MANSYCTPAEIRASLPSSGLDSTDETLLTTLAARASRIIDRLCGRDEGAFYRNESDETRYYDVRRNAEDHTVMPWARFGAYAGYAYSVSIDDAVSITNVAVDEALSGTYTAWVVDTDYWTWPNNETPIKRLDVNDKTGNKAGFPIGRRNVRVIGKFGFSATVPAEIKSATIAQSIHLWKRAQQGYADVGAVIELGQLRYANAIDAEVAAMLEQSEFNRMSFG